MFPSPQVGSGHAQLAGREDFIVRFHPLKSGRDFQGHTSPTGAGLGFHPLKSGRDLALGTAESNSGIVSIPSSRVGTLSSIIYVRGSGGFHPLKSGRDTKAVEGLPAVLSVSIPSSRVGTRRRWKGFPPSFRFPSPQVGSGLYRYFWSVSDQSGFPSPQVGSGLIAQWERL